MGLNHFPRARKQLFLIWGTGTAAVVLLLLRNFSLRSQTLSASLSRAQDRQSPLPATSLLLNILKCCFVQGGGSCRGRQPEQTTVGRWKDNIRYHSSHSGIFLVVPNKPKMGCALQHCPAQLAALPGTAPAVLGNVSLPCSTPTAPAQPGQAPGAAQTSPTGSFAVFMEFQLQMETTGSPLTAFPGFSVWPEVSKAAGRERRGQSHSHRTAPHQSCPVTKARRSLMEKQELWPWGTAHTPCPAPAQTCPAPASSHTNTPLGKYLRVISADKKQKRDDEMGSLKSHFHPTKLLLPVPRVQKTHFVEHENS